MSRKMMLVGAGALPFPFRSGWDHEFESAFLQRRVNKLSVPPEMMPVDGATYATATHSTASRA
jgi:hypothetical protein